MTQNINANTNAVSGFNSAEQATAPVTTTAGRSSVWAKTDGTLQHQRNGGSDSKVLTVASIVATDIPINGATAETTPADGDEILIYDASATANRKITKANFLTGIAASAISSGTLTHERGGLELDVSAFSGLIKIDAGTTSQAVANTDYAAATHAARHITGAADEIDGDKLDIDFTPSNYTPSTTPTEADNLDNLTAHLYGIDQALASSGLLNNTSATTNPTAGDDTGDGYAVGSLWINVTADLAFICVDASSAAAVWKPLMTPTAVSTSSTAQSIVSSLSYTQLTFNTYHDPYGWASGNTITPTAGIYAITLNLDWASSPALEVTAYIEVGGTFIEFDNVGDSARTPRRVYSIFEVNGSQAIAGYARQSSGASINATRKALSVVRLDI